MRGPRRRAPPPGQGPTRGREKIRLGRNRQSECYELRFDWLRKVRAPGSIQHLRGKAARGGAQLVALRLNACPPQALDNVPSARADVDRRLGRRWKRRSKPERPLTFGRTTCSMRISTMRPCTSRTVPRRRALMPPAPAATDERVPAGRAAAGRRGRRARLASDVGSEQHGQVTSSLRALPGRTASARFCRCSAYPRTPSRSIPLSAGTSRGLQKRTAAPSNARITPPSPGRGRRRACTSCSARGCGRCAAARSRPALRAGRPRRG